jgi:hypothetical protein
VPLSQIPSAYRYDTEQKPHNPKEAEVIDDEHFSVNKGLAAWQEYHCRFIRAHVLYDVGLVPAPDSAIWLT